MTFRTRCFYLMWWFRNGRPALFKRCRKCRAWVSFIKAHGCSSGEACAYCGLCSACIWELQDNVSVDALIDDTLVDALYLEALDSDLEEEAD